MTAASPAWNPSQGPSANASHGPAQGPSATVWTGRRHAGQGRSCIRALSHILWIARLVRNLSFPTLETRMRVREGPNSTGQNVRSEEAGERKEAHRGVPRDHGGAQPGGHGAAAPAPGQLGGRERLQHFVEQQHAPSCGGHSATQAPAAAGSGLGFAGKQFPALAAQHSHS